MECSPDQSSIKTYPTGRQAVIGARKSVYIFYIIFKIKTNKMIKIGKDLSKFSVKSEKPSTKDELTSIIENRMRKYGNECDLNDIDISLITDMTHLFFGSEFNGNISKWDTSHVTDMSYMFAWSSFNRDISEWDVSNVISMNCMFTHAEFNQPIGDWDVKNVRNMSWMFSESKFNQDISSWKTGRFANLVNMFFDCPIKEEYKMK